jgi:hypothetical protein
MLSEAISTGKPVGVVRLEGRSRRHELFLERLEAIGAARPFTGDMPERGGTATPNATATARAAVLKLMAERGFGGAI